MKEYSIKLEFKDDKKQVKYRSDLEGFSKDPQKGLTELMTYLTIGVAGLLNRYGMDVDAFSKGVKSITEKENK